MKFFRLSLSFGALSLLAGSLSSCLKEPEYSTTPEISFDHIEHIRIAPKAVGDQPLDSIRITIRYQDGDGDLGLTEAERKVAPYTYPSIFNNNFFIEPYVKNKATGKFEPLTTVGVPAPGIYTAGQYNGAFPHPTTLTDNKKSPIKGTLTYAPVSFGLGDVFVAGQTVRFTVSIADRALHLSNTITTDSIVIAPR